MQNMAPGTVAGLFIIKVLGLSLCVVFVLCIVLTFVHACSTFCDNAGRLTGIANSLQVAY